jgi:hypothetical protein
LTAQYQRLKWLRNLPFLLHAGADSERGLAPYPKRLAIGLAQAQAENQPQGPILLDKRTFLCFIIAFEGYENVQLLLLLFLFL